MGRNKFAKLKAAIAQKKALKKKGGVKKGRKYCSPPKLKRVPYYIYTNSKELNVDLILVQLIS